MQLYEFCTGITIEEVYGFEMVSKETMSLPCVMRFVTVFFVTMSYIGRSQVFAQESKAYFKIFFNITWLY